MAVITIGDGATDRASSRSFSTAVTLVDKNGAANGTGTLDVFEIFAVTTYLANVKIGTFSGSGTSYDDRDYETIGTVTAGSKQTFTGKNCDVESGDFLGIYGETGRLEVSTTGGVGYYIKAGDWFGSSAQTYTAQANYISSLYATGATVAAGNPYYYYLQQ
jgi:hypothetical protein